jgi:hypothetical protein
MKIRTQWLAIAASLMLLGCVTQVQVGSGRPVPTLAPSAHCPGGSCAVFVTADSGSGTAGNNCGIAVPDPVLDLGGPGGGARRPIAWVITSPGYKFSPGPALGHPATPPALDVKGSNNFVNPKVNLTSLTVNFIVAIKGMSHEYGLNLVKDDGTKCDTYDPWVIE